MYDNLTFWEQMDRWCDDAIESSLFFLDFLWRRSDAFSFFLFIFGGIVLSLLFVGVFVLPYFKQIVVRKYLMIAGVVPLLVLLCEIIFGLGMGGRNCGVRLLMLPLVLAICFTLAVLPVACYRAVGATRKVVYGLALLVFAFAQYWALAMLWSMTHSGFMGASC